MRYGAYKDDLTEWTAKWTAKPNKKICTGSSIFAPHLTTIKTPPTAIS